ncbi:MAG: hypothetical protein DRJ61_08535 [Acidobacteria bacterium]|nr:MAG: hypothetical protein DRJ61_08535 [Acidobacteriota bacterium]
MSGMDAIIKEFLAESAENLDQMDQDLVALEKDPANQEVLSRIFRTIHTIKGTCGFLAFGKLEAVTHSGENLLSHLRDGSLDLSPEVMTMMLSMVDAVRKLLSAIEKTGKEGDRDYSELILDLDRLDEEAGEKKKDDPKADNTSSTMRGSGRTSRIELVPEASEDAKETETLADPEAASKKKSPSKRRKKKESQAIVNAPLEQPVSGGAVAGDIDGDHEQEITAPTTSSLGESSLRVDVHVLDHLMNLVGELVLARNQILRLSEGIDDQQFGVASTRLHGVTTDLQEAVMRTRMQPISLLWKKLPRFVRDLSQQFGKKVDIQMEGQDTELDKAVIEAIQGSLLHLVRNSLDHGIETPEVRRKSGKPVTGILRLKAHHEGGNVLIEVSDDGGGIDNEAVLKRGLEAGLVSEAEAGSLDPAQIRALIFQAGFSTARRVTNVSGRGVGLDIVRNNIEAIGGSVEIHSDPGQSTSFRLKIPLTLAIIPVVLVASQGQRFAIPQLSVVELVRFDDQSGGLGIEDLNGVPVYRLRGHLLPLLYLDEELGFITSRKPGGGSVNIVVLQGDDRRFGLIVDTIEDSQEIVVKPLGQLIDGLPYAGSTILGEGAVALILDVLRLGLKAGVVSEARTHQAAPDEGLEIAAGVDRRTLLYVMGPADERLAIDFSAVDRLEFIPVSDIEKVADLPVVQYRDEILQLVWVDQTLPERRTKMRKIADDPDLDALQVVVCTVDGMRVGLIVYRILDIIDRNMDVTRPASREGIETCVVVEDRVTEIIDLKALVRLADPGFFERGLKPSSGGR